MPKHRTITKTRHGSTPVQTGYHTEVVDGKVPGGFGQLFNRVIDSGIFARLSYAAKSIYPVFVRHAYPSRQFEVSIGLGQISRDSGLPRSSVQIAVEELLEKNLIEHVGGGERLPNGSFSTKVYRLRIPHETVRDEQPIQRRSKGSREHSMPPERYTPVRREGIPSAVGKAQGSPAPAAYPSNAPADAPIPSERYLPKHRLSNTATEDAAALLEKHGVDADSAQAMAIAYGYAACHDAVEVMLARKRTGKCRNPGGLIREALTQGWEPPAGRSHAELERKRKAQELAAPTRSTPSPEDLAAEFLAIDRTIGMLDDETLSALAEEVVSRYVDNSAVLNVLRSKPARECRLMKMEIVKILRDQAKPV